jgi:signal transduction histidine kinase
MDQPAEQWLDQGSDGIHAPDGGHRPMHLSPFPAASIDRDGAVAMTASSPHVVDRELALLSNWGAIGESQHCVQFYETDGFLLSSLRGFIGTGLVEGDAGIVIATKAHRRALAKGLQQGGLNVAAVTASGQYVALDATEMLATFMRDGSPDARLFHQVLGDIISRAADGRRGVRIFGEMAALLWAGGNYLAVLRVEDLWNELRKTHRFSLFCAYPMSGFAGSALAEALAGVCAEHARVIPTESFVALPGPDERLRTIALLQQKASSLEAEVEERKRIEEQLDRSIRLGDEFLAAVSHDLKTPLTVLKGQAQILQRRAARGALDEQTILAGLEQIESKSSMMAELIDELLDVTRLRTGGALHLDRRPVDLVALVREAVAAQELATDEYQLVLLTGEPELIGIWDRVRLGRVVQNLVTNAMKYSPEGGEITLQLERERSPKGGWAVLTVQDHGIGIAEADLPHIFEWFYRGKNTSEDITGTGLGLAGTRQIVEQHGGTISVESKEGAGSTFTVRLPIDSSRDGVS